MRGWNSWPARREGPDGRRVTPARARRRPRARAMRPDFSYLKLSPAGKVARPDAAAPAAEIRLLSEGLVRVLDEEHRAVGPWNPHLDAAGTAGGAPAHAADAHFRRPHAAHPALGKDFLLHALLRRGGRVGRDGDGAAAHRHAVSLVPQPGPLLRARPADARPDVPAAFEHARHVQGPAASGHVSLARRQYLLDLRQPRNAVPAGGRLGDGGGDQGPGRRSR